MSQSSDTDPVRNPSAAARELLLALCAILDQLNTPELHRSRVEITWTGIPQTKIIPMTLSPQQTFPLATAHWCNGAWRVDHG